jgi:hypothetical protein
MFSPGHKAPWKDNASSRKFDNQVVIAFLDNHGSTAQRGKVSAQKHIERVEEDAYASFEKFIEHKAYLTNRSILATNILLPHLWCEYKEEASRKRYEHRHEELPQTLRTHTSPNSEGAADGRDHQWWQRERIFKRGTSTSSHRSDQLPLFLQGRFVSSSSNENSSAALLRNKGLAKLAIGGFVKEEKRNVKS